MNQPIRSLETLQCLLELTDSMIREAQAGHWNTVSELNAQRVQLLESRDEIIDADESEQQRMGNLIKAADARLLADISGKKELMAEASIQQRSRSTAVRSYMDAQALRSPISD